ncbi:tRNA (adenosine(37)-N6)-threonylcarbamoyltransferase complex ATPase subunit type 1 TsaE [Candidatus Peregrinibacteria bacterium]|nr:MAG: tRNA (adenosine(37)-N6)-threonylcarbamoyltransferase complex ATPase subunit type 1 TsaE [Candidatus Peregrinibacteria bacterium]
MLQRTHSPEETKALARQWIAAHPTIKLWFLKGDLGAGKTCFVKGIATFFGSPENQVKSPTFSFIEVHDNWVHVDLYRLQEEDVFLNQELEEHLQAGRTLFIEWPQRLLSWQNRPHAEIQFTHQGETERELKLTLLS